ncbi:DUF6463 family protein [Nocardia sp. NPDC050710]|uniref:DUF6463 family protein n=1 Tax=Nocardia sp. NPDC050710 TaxID=3157220 RepID=UPI0033E621AB
MPALAPWVPRLIFATAAIHFVYAFIQPNDWAGIAGEGFLATAADVDDPDYFARDATVWFMIGGIAMLAIGTLTRNALATTGRVPAHVGWYLIAIGIPLTVIYFPVTGGWLMLAIGAVALAAARRSNSELATGRQGQ